MKKPKPDDEREVERKRDDILRTMLSTPPQPNWKPTKVRKKTPRKPAKGRAS
jgi:hypothetical protein